MYIVCTLAIEQHLINAREKLHFLERMKMHYVAHYTYVYTYSSLCAFIAVCVCLCALEMVL